MKALVGAFNQEKALVGAFSVITNLRMDFFQALSEAEFSDLLRFLSLASNMRASGCLDPQEDGSTGVQVWAGGQYEASREAWTAWDTGREVEVVA